MGQTLIRIIGALRPHHFLVTVLCPPSASRSAHFSLITTMSRPAPPASSLEHPANTPAVLLRVFYLAASLLILAIQLVPALRRRFLVYGSRTTPTGKSAPSEEPAQKTALDTLLDDFAAIQVPHNYFTHFYITSVISSLFWGLWLRVWTKPGQLQVVWMLMLLQGVRRLLESDAYTSKSKSRMWFVHWLLGIAFYLAMNVSIWIEGAHQGPRHWSTTMLVPAVLTAHVFQHSFHAYLYRLRSEKKGYQLPSHPIFTNLLCPHYTCEVLIYTFLSFLAAPEGRWVSWTMVCGTIFVASNLGVTAWGTKEWYAEKFGQDKVGHRKRMVPWIW
ncbi:polyprenol reductase [Parastagonospora nodorum]|nr:polyprenol reductase [Parastagonospora nodorum]KAH3993757.1 polyprenol reductase [Parastagonospora nodorum]KAH4012857.1 polyprenol reductase [Parastagonospora nodorum]KAH4064429.1 polyprenol reductase [Parastagonospora nodorum]KAH4084150.1 polyprenol reductase [Parastagonospora nodorum]